VLGGRDKMRDTRFKVMHKDEDLSLVTRDSGFTGSPLDLSDRHRLQSSRAHQFTSDSLIFL
jgi:hypothetical protein